MLGVCWVWFEELGLTSQWGSSPTTLVHTIPGKMGMPSLPGAACRWLQALGPRRVTGTIWGELMPIGQEKRIRMSQWPVGWMDNC